MCNKSGILWFLITLWISSFCIEIEASSTPRLKPPYMYVNDDNWYCTSRVPKDWSQTTWRFAYSIYREKFFSAQHQNYLNSRYQLCCIFEAPYKLYRSSEFEKSIYPPLYMNIHFLFFVLVSSLVQYCLCYLFIEKHGIGEGRDEPVIAYSKHLCGAATGLYYVHLDLHVTFITYY